MTEGSPLGEDDALVGRRLHRALDLLQKSGGGIEPLRQALAVLVHVLDRPPRHARVHGRLGDEGRDVADQAGVEGRRDDVLGPELQPTSVVGGGHLVRHVLLGQTSQGLGAGDLHLVVHAPGAHIEGAAEDVGEAQHVVDLVGIVRPARGHDGVLADLQHLFGGDLRVRVGHGEDDRVLGHGGDHVLGQRALGRKADEAVRPDQRLRQRAVRRVHHVGRLPLVHVLGATAPERALAVHGDDVLGPHAHGLDQLEGRDAGRARAVQHHLHVLDPAVRDLAGVDQAAAEMMAVPCWSSWKTGMSSSS
jgi:hypothetical protein